MKPVSKVGGQSVRRQMVAWRGLPDEAFVRANACGSEWSAKNVINHVAHRQEAAWGSYDLSMRSEIAP